MLHAFNATRRNLIFCRYCVYSHFRYISQIVSYISRRLTVILRYIKWCTLRCQSIIIVVVVAVFVAMKHWEKAHDARTNFTNQKKKKSRKKTEWTQMENDEKIKKKKENSVFSAYLFGRFQEIWRFKAIYSISLFANPIQYIYVIISLYTPFCYF